MFWGVHCRVPHTQPKRKRSESGKSTISKSDQIKGNFFRIPENECDASQKVTDLITKLDFVLFYCAECTYLFV